jgi:hypothetical protein
MGKPSAREVTGSVLRGIVEELRSRGLFDEVHKLVPQETARVMDKPGMPLSWHKGAHTDSILEAVVALRDRDTVRAMGLAMMTHRGVGTLLRPLLDFWLKFTGSGPAALYTRLDTAATVLLRGTEFHWTANGDRAGTLKLTQGEPAPDANWALWEGVLEYAFVLTKVEGTTGRARVSPDSLICEIDIRWETGAR